MHSHQQPTTLSSMKLGFSPQQAAVVSLTPLIYSVYHIHSHPSRSHQWSFVFFHLGKLQYLWGRLNSVYDDIHSHQQRRINTPPPPLLPPPPNTSHWLEGSSFTFRHSFTSTTDEDDLSVKPPPLPSSPPLHKVTSLWACLFTLRHSFMNINNDALMKLRICLHPQSMPIVIDWISFSHSVSVFHSYISITTYINEV